MNLEKTYQDILNRAFSGSIANWSDVPPMDPMKVFADGLSCAIAEIERRQSRFTEVVLDSLPALFSFSPKKAVLPTGLFRIEPAPRLSETIPVASGTAFRFQSSSRQCLVEPLPGQHVSPFFEVVIESTSPTVLRVAFRSAGALTRVPVHFLGGGTGGNSVKDVTVKIVDKVTGNAHELLAENLLVTDDTAGLSQAGTITVGPAEGDALCANAATVEVRLELAAPVRQDAFSLNVLRCQILRVEEFLQLGELKGEPWEELTLDPRIVQPPAELLLHFPDDHSTRIRRVDADILKLRHTNPERFSQAFFYNGANHSLVIPGAHRILQNYTGGITILAQKVSMTPESPWVEGMEGLPGDNASWAQAIVAIAPLTGLVPREEKADFLRRFYSTMRSVGATTPRERELIVENLRDRVLAADESVRGVEIAVNEERKMLAVHVLCGYPRGEESLRVPPAVYEKLSASLGDLVPLDYDFRILPFRRVPLGITIEAEVELDTYRRGVVSDEVLAEKLTSKLTHLLLPPPYGRLDAGAPVSSAAIFSDLRNRLEASQGDNSHLRRTEVKRLHGQLVHGDTSQFVSSLTRRPGEIFDPHIDVVAKVRTHEVYLEESLTLDRFAERGALHA